MPDPDGGGTSYVDALRTGMTQRAAYAEATALVPPGTVMLYCGRIDQDHPVPAGWLLCDGAVINGRESAKGAERSKIERAADATAVGLKVPLTVARAGDHVVLSVGASADKPKSPAVILLLPYVASREVAIGRGENARRKVTYTNVVRDIRVVGDWTGAAVTQEISADEFKDYDGVVVLLQQGSTGKPGAILGAARATLR